MPTNKSGVSKTFDTHIRAWCNSQGCGLVWEAHQTWPMAAARNHTAGSGHHVTVDVRTTVQYQVDNHDDAS